MAAASAAPGPPVSFSSVTVLSALQTAATPRLRAASLIRLSSLGGWRSYIWRNLLISLHGCDVSTRYAIPSSLSTPHPIGIVIGEGVRIGDDVTIYQNVTLGRDRRGGYPRIEDGACLMPGASIVGGVTVGALSIIGANALVTDDVPPGHVVRAMVTTSSAAATAPAEPGEWPRG